MVEKGLIGILDVNVGDLIRLSNFKADVAGYVVSQTKNWVKLSHENPLISSAFGTGRYGFFPGNRKYYLKHFTNYHKILDKKNK